MNRPPVPYRLNLADVEAPPAPGRDVVDTALTVVCGLLLVGFGLLMGAIVGAWWGL